MSLLVRSKSIVYFQMYLQKLRLKQGNIQSHDAVIKL